MTSIDTAHYPLANAPDESFYRQRSPVVLDLNDVWGGPRSIFERLDPQAIATKLIRSDVEQWRREVNVFGREGAVPYVVREVARLIQEQVDDPFYSDEEKAAIASRKHLVLANIEPRDQEGEGENASEFVTARVGDYGLQVTGSPFALSHVKDQIHPDGVFVCPNDNDFYYEPEVEQYRSAFFERLSWRPDRLVRGSLDLIPDPQDGIRYDYADYFGNVTLGNCNHDHLAELISSEAVTPSKGVNKGNRIIGFEVDGHRRRAQDFLYLGDAALGSLVKGRNVVYRNQTRGRVHNLSWGWITGIDEATKQNNSPHGKFRRRRGFTRNSIEPREGSTVGIR